MASMFVFASATACGGSCVATADTFSFGSRIGVPSAARTVDAASSVLTGTLSDNRVLLNATALKGPDPSENLVLENPYEGMPMRPQLSDLGLTEASEVVVFGELREADEVLFLNSSLSSIWPYGHQHRTFPSATVEQNIAFVEELLAYSNLTEDPDALLREWSNRLTGPAPHAALAYLEIAVERDFADTMSDFPLVMRALGAHLLAGRVLDGAAQQQLALIAPMLPQTLGLPLMIEQAETAKQNEAKLLKNVVASSLGARGAEVTADDGRDAFEAAFADLKPVLRKADARRLLAAFDLGISTLDNGLADDLMRAVLEREPLDPAADGSAAARRASWANEIVNFPD